MTRSYSAHPTDTGHDIFKGMAQNKKAKGSTKKARPQIQVGEHGRYQIKSGLLAGKFVARAFPKTPTTARGLIAEASGATEEAAVTALHEVIDARENRRAQARRMDPRTGEPVPSVEEFVEAIGQVALTVPQRAMLTALSRADADGLTEARLANAGGYKSQISAKRSFASAGQSIANYLASGTISSSTITGSDGISLSGISRRAANDEDSRNWILQPELRDAVQAAL